MQFRDKRANENENVSALLHQNTRYYQENGALRGPDSVFPFLFQQHRQGPCTFSGTLSLII